MERNLGVLQGKAYPQPYFETDIYEDMETIESVAERSAAFLDEIRRNHRNETIVLVSHGYIIKVMLALLRNLPLTEFHKIKLMNNSSYTIEPLNQIIRKG